jgi:hypothetical protein
MKFKKILSFILIFLSLTLPGWCAYSLYLSQDEVCTYPGAKVGYAGLGYNGKLMACDNAGKVWLYSAGAWSSKTDGGDSTYPRSMFIDHAGLVYVSWATGIWTTPDDGANWTKELTLPQPTGKATAITEDELGNVYAGQYQTTVSYDARLYKRVAGGSTWTEITPTSGTWQAGSTFRHVHFVYYCPYRKTLFVALGDAGGNSIYYSTDKGATFTVWTGSNQTCGITSDSMYIYGVGDAGTNRDIWRATTAGGTITSVYTNTDSVTSWLPDVDENGNIIVIYSVDAANNARFMGSSDHGTTWTDYKDFTTSFIGIAYAKPSYYYTLWDGWYYGGAITNTFGKCRLYPSTAQFKIDPTNGLDYLKNGYVSPWKTAEAAEIAMKSLASGQGIKLLANVADRPLNVSASSVVINGNTYGATGNVTASPTFTSDLEGSNPYTSNTATHATFLWNDTAQAHSVTHSTSITRDGSAVAFTSLGLKQITAQGSGATLWVSGWCYLTEFPTGGTYLDIMLARDAGAAVTVSVRIPSSALIPVIRTSSPSMTYVQGSLNQTALTLNTWTKIKMAIYLHATQGTITFWINNALAIKVIGINTLQSTTWSDGRWGASCDANPAGATATIYWDDIAVSTTDPDQPNAIEVQGNNNTLMALNQTKPVNITGTGNTLQASIFNATSLTVASGATGSLLYNLTMYGSSGTGITANETCTLKNIVSMMGAGTDLSIAAGKTVTGYYSRFQDAAKAGSGTYTDGGHSTWNASNPNFKTAGTDFHLTAASPCVAAGVKITGVNSDYISKTYKNPPSIGAYEFYSSSTKSRDLLLLLHKLLH